MFKTLLIVGVLTMSTTASTARAALLQGIPVYAQLLHQDVILGPSWQEDAGPALVGPGLEFNDFGSAVPSPPLHPVIVDIDVSDTQIIVTAVNDQPLSEREVLLINIDPGHVANVPPITGVRLNPATNWAGFGLPSLNLNSIQFNLSTLTASAGQQIVVDIIPEPGSGALAAAAGAGLAAAGRRRKT